MSIKEGDRDYQSSLEHVIKQPATWLILANIFAVASLDHIFDTGNPSQLQEILTYAVLAIDGVVFLNLFSKFKNGSPEEKKEIARNTLIFLLVVSATVVISNAGVSQ